MTQPVRPIFQNGQRLTAERLTQAIEYLRTFIRRLALAPLGSGVAAGFELSSQPNQLQISPGVAIDGSGQLLVVETLQAFSLGAIEAQAGVFPIGGLVRVIVEPGFSAAGMPDPCQDPLSSITDSVSIRFQAVAPDNTLDEPESADPVTSCVDPWSNLEAGGGCGVVLGELRRESATTFSVETRKRQGVSPEFGVLRSPNGRPAIVLGTQLIDLGNGALLTEAVSVGQPLYAQANVRVKGDTVVNTLEGTRVRATEMGTRGNGFTAATTWTDTGRVVVLNSGDGTGLVPDGCGGTQAVAVELDIAVGGDVTGPGAPLDLIGSETSVKVRRSTTATSANLIGLSAGQSQFHGGRRIVPLATSGLVKATLAVGASVTTGQPVAVAPDLQSLIGINTETAWIVGRAAHSRFNTSTDRTLYVWVTQPYLINNNS